MIFLSFVAPLIETRPNVADYRVPKRDIGAVACHGASTSTASSLRLNRSSRSLGSSPFHSSDPSGICCKSGKPNCSIVNDEDIVAYSAAANPLASEECCKPHRYVPSYGSLSVSARPAT